MSVFFWRSKEQEVAAPTARAAQETVIYSGMTSLLPVHYPGFQLQWTEGRNKKDVRAFFPSDQKSVWDERFDP